MKSRPHPLRLQLNILASKIERDLLSAEEKAGLVKIFRRLAEGETFDQIMGVKNAANRPQTDVIEKRVYDVEIMCLPVKRGGEGLTKSEAIAKVADLHHVAVSTIESDLKSQRGKVVRKMVKAHQEFPFQIERFTPGGYKA
jgi:hypothetical protein